MQVSYTEKKKIFNKTLGQVIKKLRTDNNLSVRATAYSIDLSKTTILLAENGSLDPQITTFCRLAEAFNLKPSELLNMIENELPANWSFSD